MAEIKIELSSIEVNVDDSATIYTFDSPRTYLFKSTPELIEAGVSVQTYGVITVPLDVTLSGTEVVEVEYVNKTYSALLSDIIGAEEGDEISFSTLFITLEDIADVEITDATAGNALVYDASGKWVNGAGGGGGSESLEDLTDVDITSVSNGDVLKWDSTSEKWINGAGGNDGYTIEKYYYAEEQEITLSVMQDMYIGAITLAHDFSESIDKYYVTINDMLGEVTTPDPLDQNLIIVNGEPVGALMANDGTWYIALPSGGTINLSIYSTIANVSDDFKLAVDACIGSDNVPAYDTIATVVLKSDSSYNIVSGTSSPTVEELAFIQGNNGKLVGAKVYFVDHNDTPAGLPVFFDSVYVSQWTGHPDHYIMSLDRTAISIDDTTPTKAEIWKQYYTLTDTNVATYDEKFLYVTGTTS